MIIIILWLIELISDRYYWFLFANYPDLIDGYFLYRLRNSLNLSSNVAFSIFFFMRFNRIATDLISASFLS